MSNDDRNHRFNDDFFEIEDPELYEKIGALQQMMNEGIVLGNTNTRSSVMYLAKFIYLIIHKGLEQ